MQFRDKLCNFYVIDEEYFICTKTNCVIVYDKFCIGYIGMLSKNEKKKNVLRVVDDNFCKVN